MDETKEMFDTLMAEIPPHNDKHPGDGVQITRDRERIFIWPKDGGCLILKPDGTWAGDIAPFCD